MIKAFCDICRKEIEENQHTSIITIETSKPETLMYSDVCMNCTKSVSSKIDDLRMVAVSKRGLSK